MGDYSISIDGYETTVKGLDRATIAVQDKLRKVVKNTSRDIERKEKELAPHDLGDLRGGIRTEYDTDGLGSTTGPEDTVVARTMNYGRKPNSRMPPPDALAGWAKRHGMEGQEYVIARSIAKKGIRGRHFVEGAADACLGDFVRDCQEAVAESTNEVSK